MALYSDKVMDHFMNPRNVGKLDNPSGVGQVGNARCGDIMKIYIQVEDGVKSLAGDSKNDGCEVQHLWLRLCHCQQLYGNGVD